MQTPRDHESSSLRSASSRQPMRPASVPRQCSSQLADELFRPLNEELPPLRVPLKYRLSAVVSATALALSVLCYMLLMFGTAWFALDYLIGHVWLATQGVAVWGHLVLGSLVVVVAFLLVKPILHVYPRGLEPMDVSRDEQPVLYAYVERLCQTLQTPKPHRIRLVNGSMAAGNLRGLLGSLQAPKLELVLGLTLIAGTDLREFSSILAHELGHFSRHPTWRILAVIRSTNMWLARAIYEPDRFDYWLAGLSAKLVFVLRWPFSLARLIMRLGRGVLWVFMMLGHLASCMISRFDEYNSDQYSARIAGSKVVASALRRTLLLAMAEEAVLDDVGGSWQEKRLPDDLAQVTIAKVQRLPADQQQRILKMINNQRTGWLDTHPSLVDRIRAVRGLSETGPITSQRPAHLLCHNFFKLCQKSSLDFYRYMLKDDFDKACIVPAEALVREHAETEEAQDALTRYYQGDVPIIRPIFPDSAAGLMPANVEQAQDYLAAARDSMLQSQAELQKLLNKYVKNQELQYTLFEIKSLVYAGLQLPPQPDMGLAKVNAATVAQRQAAAEDDENSLAQRLAPLEQRAQRRMSAALQLLRANPALLDEDGRSPAEQTRQVDRLLAAAGTLEDAQGELRALAWNARVLMGLLHVTHQGRAPSRVHKAVAKHAEQTRSSMKALQGTLGETAYPFEHAEKDQTIASFLVAEIHAAKNHPQLAMGAMDALERVDRMVWRVLSHLALIAEKVEAAVGLAPQEEPASPFMPDTIEIPAGTGRGVGQPAGLQMALSLAVMLVIGGISAIYGAANSRYAVLPKHDSYRPTIIASSWTPPPRANVWNLGFQPYRTNLPEYNKLFNVNPHGYTPSGMSPTATPDPWGRHRTPGWQGPSGSPWSGRDRGSPGFPSHQPNSRMPGRPGYQPRTPGYQPRTPGYQPYQPPTPGYQPPTPGYQPPTPGYQPPTPGYQPPR